MLHQVGVSFDLYYDARKHNIKKGKLISVGGEKFLCKSEGSIRTILSTSVRISVILSIEFPQTKKLLAALC